MNNTSRFFLFTIPLFCFSFGGDSPDLKKQYSQEIIPADLCVYLSVIASDSFEGRETATRGLDMTAEFIAGKFRSFGIPELPSGGYYQDVPLLKFIPGNGSVMFNDQKFVYGKDFYYTPGIDDGKTDIQKIIFAGYGIQDSLYKDYSGIDISGSAVMFLADEPIDKNGNSLITGKKELSSWSTQRRRKINEAKKRGAAALLIIVPDFQKKFLENKKYLSAPTLKPDEDLVVEIKSDNPPVLYISKEMADMLLVKAKKKTNTGQAIAAIAKKKKTFQAEINSLLVIDIERESEKVHSENVLGFIEGGDLKKEIVVVTAHMDHLGKDSTEIYNGADDDGSGTTAVIELAKIFAQAKKDGHGPRRSMLFMTFTGEEKGLLGSRWYSDHPVFPLENTVCDLNIDMIGRIDKDHQQDTGYVYVIGSDMLSSELKKINETNNNNYTKLQLDYRYDDPNDPNSFYTRSDHYNFAKHGIPVAFFFNGVHEDYHKPTDEIQKIDFPLMAIRARLVFCTAWEIANRDARLVVDKKQKNK